MQRRTTIVAATLLAMLYSGCGDVAGADGQSLVGTWQETIETTPGDENSSTIKQSMAEATQTTLDIRDDNTFTLTIFGDESTGTWAFAEDRLTLTYEVTTGWALGDESLALTVEDDGDALRTLQPPGAATTVFTRQ